MESLIIDPMPEGGFVVRKHGGRESWPEAIHASTDLDGALRFIKKKLTPAPVKKA